MSEQEWDFKKLVKKLSVSQYEIKFGQSVISAGNIVQIAGAVKFQERWHKKQAAEPHTP